jgi:hypothetical protein
MVADFGRAFAGPAAFWDPERGERIATEPRAVVAPLVLPTGRVAIHDPGYEFAPDPLDRDVPPGAHRVDLALRSWTADDGTVTPRAMIAAVRVRLRPARPARFAPVRSALRQSDLDVGVDSGLLSIFDRALLPELNGAAILDAIPGCAPEGTAGSPTAHVAAAPAAGSLFTCQAGMGDGSYRAWWGIDAGDDAVELIVDFGLLSHSLWRTTEIPAGALLGTAARLRLALLGTGVELEPVPFDSVPIPYPSAVAGTSVAFRRPAGPLWEFTLLDGEGAWAGSPGRGQLVPGPWFEVFDRRQIERASTLRIRIHEGVAPDGPLDEGAAAG